MSQWTEETVSEKASAPALRMQFALRAIQYGLISVMANALLSRAPSFSASA